MNDEIPTATPLKSKGSTAYQTVIDFWFKPEHRKLWFNATPEFDSEIRRRFYLTWEAAGTGNLDEWRETAKGALALVILLDQFPLNMLRGTPESFSTEAKAREIAGYAIDKGFDGSMDDVEKALLYLPFMHSEDLADQDISVNLFEAANLKENLRWANHHRDIVRRFGRFPHRNQILRRESTAEEIAWLKSPEGFKG